jgi:O-antigen/teichoic acid export membrane protein
LFIATVGSIFSILLGPIVFRVIPTSLPDFYPYFAYAIGFQIWYQFQEYRLTLFQVNERPGAYAGFNITTSLVIFVCVLVFVVALRGGASDFLLGRLVGISLITLFTIYGMRGCLSYGWSGKKFKAALYYAAPLIPHVLSMSILNFADRFLLGVYSTTAEVGLYTLAYNLGFAMYVVTVAIYMAWGPFFFKAVNDGEEQYRKVHDYAGKAVAISAAIAIFGATISGDFVAILFSEEYHPAASIVPLIIDGYLLFSLSSMFSHSILYKKKTHYISLISVIAAVVNIMLNIWLIPKYGMAGAAWATIISFGLQTWAIYLIAVYVLPVPYPVGKILLALGIFFVILILTQYDRASSYFVYLFASVAILAVLGASFILPGRMSRRE